MCRDVKAMGQIRWLILILVLFQCWSLARAQDVVLVANKGVQISAISESDLRAIFVGFKTRFSDGSHAVPVTLRGGPAHEVFLNNHVGESPEDFRAQWRKTVFTGQGAMPKICDSETALIEYVAATPGAVGYVSRISPEEQNKVKSLIAVK
jgi:ABC-type phosphate transport system substrate-binding protein